jgi:hypothetical protein
MTRLSERLEREAEDARRDLEGSLLELRLRLTPGQIVDDARQYAQGTAVAEFARNLARDVRQNPLPLLLIVAGVAWAVIAGLARAPAGGRTVAPLAAEPAGRHQAAAEEWAVTPVVEPVE